MFHFNPCRRTLLKLLMSEVNWEEVRVGVNVFRRYDPGGAVGVGSLSYFDENHEDQIKI